MKRKGILTVVSGFSGAGKGTVMKALMAEYKDTYALSVSATTRNPRPGEVDGVDYFFRTKEEFEQMIADNALIEHACYVGNYYGTPKAYVDEQLETGKDVILEIEIQGALDVKKRFPDTILIFVTPPDADELKNRLVNRGTEDMATINARLSRASQEAEFMNQYDYIVVNDTVPACVENIHSIIENEHDCASRNINFINKIREELKCFSKGEEIMIHPSYVELMKVVNNDVEIGEEPVVNSRYSIVIATAKRARQIIGGDEPLVENAKGKKPLSIAVEELYTGKVKIMGEDAVSEDNE